MIDYANTRPSVAQTEASRFASTRNSAETTAANQRRNGHRKAIALLVAGRSGQARMVVWRTFKEQVETLGMHLHETPGGVSW